MALNLSRFAVLGLHGKLDVDIRIRDNRLILIGVNGLGKTTVINFIYFVLTEQWVRLLDIEFSSIELTINGEHIVIPKADVQSKAKASVIAQRQLSRYEVRSPFPQGLIRRLVAHPMFPVVRAVEQPSQQRIVRQIARDLEVPLQYLTRVLDDLPVSIQTDLFASKEGDPSSIAQLAKLTSDAGRHQVIYLPTYRRIEQDLKAVFPHMDEDELRKLTSEAATLAARAGGHVELVQFGMQDVEKKIADELANIQRRTREQLSSLTAAYLQDVIRNRADRVSPDLIKLMDEPVVSFILGRVEENTLSTDDKHEVEQAIRRVRSGSVSASTRDQYLTYFFSRLMEIYTEVFKSEENIRQLVKTCNRYFERKQLVYNDTDYSCHVLDADGSELSWRMLSSGEKQVASLFTHLYLTPAGPQIVLIDEPELSLSVPWQKTLLTDIADSKNCQVLIAVTHSPFIYSNELDKYAIDLARLIGYRSTPTQ